MSGKSAGCQTHGMLNWRCLVLGVYAGASKLET